VISCSGGGTKSALGDVVPKLFMLAEAISDIRNHTCQGANLGFFFTHFMPLE
jgi:hypothetical protein